MDRDLSWSLSCMVPVFGPVVCCPILLARAFACDSQARRIGCRYTSVQKAVFVCVFAIGAFIVILSMYFAFTFNTEAVIDGVQGRYFLPLLPILLLVFRNGVIVTNIDYGRALLYTMAVLNVAYVVRIYVMALAGGV